ncbi:T9SS type A sorting domain-containing protein [Aurantibacillus circumpalustris]|uniref:T9SS type A sorting domain-containing protein n=1 Tax=Aurantibacillus circumpalustris TaxID=3036359 RepID=UPI00295A614E|nr:Omp28-related outer membrane protein [Aurantibacillus circumpalustris]
MKRSLLSFFAASSVLTAFAQLPVGTAPENKRVVLEEFTGIHCGYCPDGHVKANAMVTANPNKVFLINIHSGSFATAAAGEPDFKTTEGTAIDGMAGQLIAGYPAGTVNRRVFSSPQNPGGMAQSRGTWAASGAIVMAESAYCNVALQGTINVTTRVLTVQAEVYYTGTSTVSTNNLHIMLLEDGIVGPQSNYGNPYWNSSNYNADGTYNHNHVLRKVITPGVGGLTIPTPTMGVTFSTTQSYTIPLTYGASGKTTECLLGRLELVGFVTETDRNTINAAAGPISLTGFTSTLDVATNSLKTETEICAGNLNPSFKFTNLGSTPVTAAVFSYKVNNGAVTNYNWTGAAINPMTTSGIITIPTIAFTPNASNSLDIDVVSVNGSTDQNLVNNPLAKTIAVTTKTANSLSMVMQFTQDQYGSESKWTVYDELTNAVIETDGPFTNLSASGTALHTKSFTIDSNTCYRLVVEDSYGDGINAGFGVGGYVLKSGTTALITSNGVYAKGEEKYYKSFRPAMPVVTVGILESNMNIGSVNLFPNPTSGNTSLSIELTQNETLSISVVNTIGQIVYSSVSNEMNAGKNTIQLNAQNWANGVYFVNISSDKGVTNKKLTVNK